MNNFSVQLWPSAREILRRGAFAALTLIQPETSSPSTPPPRSPPLYTLTSGSWYPRSPRLHKGFGTSHPHAKWTEFLDTRGLAVVRNTVQYLTTQSMKHMQPQTPHSYGVQHRCTRTKTYTMIPERIEQTLVVLLSRTLLPQWCSTL